MSILDIVIVKASLRYQRQLLFMLFFKIYNILSWFSWPIVRIYLFYRLCKNKENPQRMGERYGKSSIQRCQNKKLVWFHCASVGESFSILPLLNRFPKHQILITSTTLTSANFWTKHLECMEGEVKGKEGPRIIHQFAPFDHPLWVKRFLIHWQPSVGIFLESELWPNLIYKASKRFPLVLLNGRLSPKSYRIWRMAPSTFKKFLSKFSKVYVQSQLDQRRFDRLGIKNAEVLGNLKYNASPLPVHEDMLELLSRLIDDRKSWACVSTHAGEEEIILNALEKKPVRDQKLLTILAPRHPNRIPEVIKFLKQRNLSYLLFSELSGSKASELPDILLIDSIGQLGNVFQTTKIVFVGGSLVKIGGHNPIEPALFHCCILHGSYVHKSIDIYTDLKDTLIEVTTPIAIAEILVKLLKDNKAVEERGQKAYEIVKSKAIDLDRLTHNLNQLINYENTTILG